MVLPHTGDTNTDGQMNIGTRVRGYLLAVYCAVRLYIHGFVEMVGQGWQRIELDESIDGEYFRGRVVLCTGGASGIGKYIIYYIYCNIYTTAILYMS